MKKRDVISVFERRAPLVIWLTLVTLLLLGSLPALSDGIRFESNILALLPESERDPVVQDYAKRLNQRVAQKIVYLLQGENTGETEAAAERLTSLLSAHAWANPLYSPRREGIEGAFYDLYFPARYQCLSPSTREDLKAPAGAARMIENAERLLYSPASPSLSAHLDKDPLFLFSLFGLSYPRPIGNIARAGDHLYVEGGAADYALLPYAIAGDVFAPSIQDRALSDLGDAEDALRSEFPDIVIKRAGALFFAHDGRSSIQADIAWIGAGSVAGIILLVVATFRSAKQLFLCISTILIGVACASLSSILIFGEVHLFTFGFGASLIGVCIDYAFHYLTESTFSQHPARRGAVLVRLLPGLTIGFLTSALAYLAFFGTPFPGLQQIAVFSIIGLSVSFSTVVCVYPYLLKGGGEPRAPPAAAPIAAFLRFWDRANRSVGFKGMLFLLLIACLALASQTEPDDDIRSLQSASGDLVEMQKEVNEILGVQNAPRYFIVEGESLAGALEKEERVVALINKLGGLGDRDHYQAISQALPSARRQMENRNLIKEKLMDSGLLLEYMTRIGFQEAAIAKAVSSYEEDVDIITPEEFLASAIGEPYRHLSLDGSTRGHATAIALNSIGVERAQRIAQEVPSVTLVDPVNDISTLLRTYRDQTGYIIVFAYIATYCILSLRYGLAQSLRIVLPPVLASLLTIAAMTQLTGVPFNLFSLLSLFLILGIGLDYSIFHAESPSHRELVVLATALSAMTTVLSFGLLYLSSAPVLKSFGFPLSLGISLAFLLSPLAMSRKYNA